MIVDVPARIIWVLVSFGHTYIGDNKAISHFQVIGEYAQHEYTLCNKTAEQFRELSYDENPNIHYECVSKDGFKLKILRRELPEHLSTDASDQPVQDYAGDDVDVKPLHTARHKGHRHER